jgi:membrane-bound serine protease (ClpP class)
MRRVLLILSLTFICFTEARAQDPESAPRPVVVRIRLDNEAITPVVAHFLQRATRQAEEAGAECLVIELDTPGGLLDSTQRIVKDIVGSPVPVVVYVSPSTARAASAGMFITLSSHVAAMAPGTRIGAAHPVEMGGLPITPPNPSPQPSEGRDEKATKAAPASSPMEEKIVKDTKAWARGLAKLRNRNAEWAEQAVEKSESIIASEAVELHVVDLIAADLTSLLKQIDGREITLQTGTANEHTVRLRTMDAEIVTVEQWWGEKLLGVISNPNVALLLMMFGVYGILHELFSPGWGVSGTLGVISLVLAFFGLSVLPINYAGLALVIVALALFAAEPFFASYGVLAIGGIVCLILGGTMLVDSPTGFMKVSLSVLIPVAVATALIVVFLVSQIFKAQRSRVRTGSESMQGSAAEASNNFLPEGDYYRGRVRVRGEWWNARSASPVAAGETVRIDKCQGLMLLVSKNGSPPPISEDTPIMEDRQKESPSN